MSVYAHTRGGKSGIPLLRFAARPEECENLTAKLIGAVLTTLLPQLRALTVTGSACEFIAGTQAFCRKTFLRAGL